VRVGEPLAYIGTSIRQQIVAELRADAESGLSRFLSGSVHNEANNIHFTASQEKESMKPPLATETARSLSQAVFFTHDLWRIIAVQLTLLALTYYASFLLRFDFVLDKENTAVFLFTLPLILLIKCPLLYCGGLFRGWWRYVGVSDFLDLTIASIVSTLLTYLLLFITFRVPHLSRAAVAIDGVLTICVLGGARLMVRIYTEHTAPSLAQKRTLIVGAGEAGRALAHELRRNMKLHLLPIGFIDDDPRKRHVKIGGIKVLGSCEEIGRISVQQKAECILLAVPSANRDTVRRIVEKCRACHVELKILPAITDFISSTDRISRVRGVRVEDLLGRQPAILDVDNIRLKLHGKVTLVTGAGGSIGSELTRQLGQFGPEKMVLLERSENDLHKLHLELSARFPDIVHVPVVGDILDVGLLREVLAEHRPSSVFHAAAYKHVPMMERNCFQAVRNNIFGTYNVALVSKQYGVDDVVLISSDKAVNPTNIMGVTKRVAELVVLALQNQRTRFVSVRFGNVLGSNGSVLPLFEQQIASGGPVTVTHPDAKRYFMTIPEAAQLVLQTSVMGHGGEIFLLEMGEPIRIVDLANNLIRLSGLEPDRDIKIVYTGLRPGEKLFEELQLQREGVKRTGHAKIMVLDGGRVDFQEVRRWLDELSLFVETKNVYGLIQKLTTIVPEYSPSADILSLCEIDRHDSVINYSRARAHLSAAAESAA
jgi:FlaA1/EpsC-like NDP-sugar epimerase